MSDLAIRVENLGKRYRIGERTQGMFRYKSLRESISSLFQRSNAPSLHHSNDSIWALRNVSFEVRRGEVVGIIGRNGAGKSTLLKILSQITEPTEGYAEIHGRVGSLLEVGTGFHPELTGRENIYLNGAILGMKKAEIDRKFDEIVAFAGVEKFIDTPVKHYSSGMYVRLAFAVAAHLEPEILFVDEVLAVGDAAFQKKCLGKMGGVAKEGRTVLFISHNMAAVRTLCSRVAWLNSGILIKCGNTEDVVGDYEKAEVISAKMSDCLVERNREEFPKESFYISRVALYDDSGELTGVFHYNDQLILIVDLFGEPPTRAYNIEFRFHNELDQLVCVGSSAFHGLLLNRNTKKIKIQIGPLSLTSGHYTISLSAVDSQSDVRYDNWTKCIMFEVIECRPFAAGLDMPTRREGVCVVNHSFAESG